jgi:transposase InsO family protein
MCEVLEISISTYYKYKDYYDQDYDDYLIIKNVFDQSKRTYGYRRITEELQEQGHQINHKRVLRLMNKYGLQPRYIKQYKNYSKQYIKENVKDNILKRNFNQPGWVTDITYLIINGKRAYLSTILDLETRKVVSYHISKQNDNELVITTLLDAIKRKDPSGLILHSDQGPQYLSTEYRAICEANRITISMSRKGNPLDNAAIESFHSLLKKETLYNNNITSIKEYIGLVHEWIEFYNTTRRKQKK